MVIGLTSAALISSAPKSLAAQPITYKGVALSPAIEQLTLSPSQPSLSYKVYLHNDLQTPLTLGTSTLDFKSLNDSGGIAFIGSSARNASHTYGLANWIILPKSPITLAPNQGILVPIGIDNRADLAPGGHYAAVLFSVINPAQSGVSAKVNLNEVVSSLVFLTKSGGERYGLNLQSVPIGAYWLNLPDKLSLYFANTGNTQTPPRGTVVITDPRGKAVSSGIINSGSALVLPTSTRVFVTSLNKLARPFWPGFYHARITYQPDAGGVVKTYNARFLFINLALLLEAVAVLVVVSWIVRKAYRWLRRAKQRRAKH